MLQGAQVAVKVTMCYEAAFVALQLLCHLGDAKLPLSRAARIKARHVIGVFMMIFVILVSPLAAVKHAVRLHKLGRRLLCCALRGCAALVEP